MTDQLRTEIEVTDCATEGTSIVEPAANTCIPSKRSLSQLLCHSTKQQINPVHLSPGQRFTKELGQYMTIETDTSEDPLIWWKKHEHMLPTLSSIAKKYLCICATSCASERLFSSAGNIVTKKRNCLKPHNVERMVFLASNLQ